jgi:hypothetical protein
MTEKQLKQDQLQTKTNQHGARNFVKNRSG